MSQAQKMKKSVSELKQDIADANKMIAQAKESGNKRQLNKGRQQRLDAWRILRDEHGMEPPSHIAKALGEPKEKKKEPTEFTKTKEQPAESKEMVFTTVELYGRKEAARMAKADRKLERMLAKMTPKQRKEYWAGHEEKGKGAEVAAKAEIPKREASKQELHVQVQAWLSNDPRYKKLTAEAARHEAAIKQASEIVESLYSKRMPSELSEEVMESLDTIFVHQDQLANALFQMGLIMKKKKDEFGEKHSSNPALVNAYSAELARLDKRHGAAAVTPFSNKEQRIIAKTGYDFYERKKQKERAEVEVKGKNRLQMEMKRRLLEKAEDLLEELQEPTPEEQETMEKIRDAARQPNVDADEMLRVALGEEIDKDTQEEVELALLASTVDELETKVAVAERRRPKVARASRRGKKEEKGPVKVASLERKKKEKEA